MSNSKLYKNKKYEFCFLSLHILRIIIIEAKYRVSTTIVFCDDYYNVFFRLNQTQSRIYERRIE